MSRIFFDTNLFIYLFEDHPEYAAKVQALLTRMDERGDELITSWITLAEIQIKPKSLGDEEICRQYKSVLQSIATIIPFDEQASEAYLRLRVNTPIKGPDSLQLACAAAAGVEVFVTNDLRLQKLRVPGIHFITSIERVPI